MLLAFLRENLRQSRILRNCPALGLCRSECWRPGIQLIPLGGGGGWGDGGRMPSRDTDLFGQCCRPFSADVAAASANTSPDDRRVSTSELAPLGTPPLDGRLPGAAFSPPPPFSRISPSAQWASGNCATSAVRLWRASRTGLREPICHQSLVSCTFQDPALDLGIRSCCSWDIWGLRCTSQ